MGEVHLTYKGMAEVMFEKACLDSRTVEREVDKCIADFYDPQGCLFDGVKE